MLLAELLREYCCEAWESECKDAALSVRCMAITVVCNTVCQMVAVSMLRVMLEQYGAAACVIGACCCCGRWSVGKVAAGCSLSHKQFNRCVLRARTVLCSLLSPLVPL